MRRPPFSSKYTVLSRDNTGQVGDFSWQAGGQTSRQIWATIKPLSDRALSQLPEGLRTRATYTCSTFEFLVTTDFDGPLGDLVVVEGLEYEVHGGKAHGRFAGAPFGGNKYILAEPELA